jgi:hypothetical protein
MASGHKTLPLRQVYLRIRCRTVSPRDRKTRLQIRANRKTQYAIAVANRTDYRCKRDQPRFNGEGVAQQPETGIELGFEISSRSERRFRSP